jgi:uncharacterized protein (TIGR03905 family)
VSDSIGIIPAGGQEMKMQIDHQTEGTCCCRISITLDGEIIKDVEFDRGCPGNLIGIKKLVIGKNRKEIIEQLKGIRCFGKETSCPDQLAQALAYDEANSEII